MTRGGGTTENGRYTICLNADGYAGAGELLFMGTQGQGHDGHDKVELQLTDLGSRSGGIIDVLMSPGVVNTRLPAHDSLPVTGTVEDTRFNLIGVGPLGVIVSLTDEYVSGLRTR